MKKAIYVITNKINKKQYIGQSKCPDKRFKQHCGIGHRRDNSLVDKAIRKYGQENFTMEILGWYENYNEMEKYYISIYKSLAPNGYNILAGGEEPPHWSGEQHPRSKLTEQQVKNIIEDLKNWDMSFKQIQKKYRITVDMVRHIYDGTSWHQEDETYPLRPEVKEINRLKANEVKRLLKETSLSQKEIGKKVGWNRSAVTMINIGKNHFDPNEIYPIRK